MRQMQLFREYLRQRIQQPPDARTLAMLRGIAGAMRNGPTEDLLGVVFDDAGHVLVLSGLLRPSDKPLEVVLGDGSTGQAQVIGSDPQLDLSVLKLLGTAPGWTARAAAPAPGALLLSMAARRGAASWVVASISPATQRRGAEERFPLALEDPGPVFLFNGQGELVALGNERVATPVAALERELKLLMTVGHIVRQDFGVGYEVLGPNAVERQDQPALTRRPALKVERVKAGSLAEQAGVKKGDIILSVGEHPVYPFMLPRIMRELATRTGAMKIVLLREGKEVTVEVAAPEEGNVGR
jgi:S1-C subfamily serine protease